MGYTRANNMGWFKAFGLTFVLLALGSLLMGFPASASAARLVTTGFEWQSMVDGIEVSNDFGGAIDTTIKHSGAASAELSGSIPTLTSIGFEHSQNACTNCYVRWYIYVDNITSGGVVAASLGLFSGATNVIALEVTNSGGTYTVTPYYNNYGGNLTTFNINPDQWHMVEVFYNTAPADGSEVMTVRLDGVQQSTSAALTFTTKSFNVTGASIYNGTGGSETASIMYVDDIAVNDTLGTGQTSYPGTGNIAMLVPTGDGSANCTSGAGDWANIDEIPPDDTATAGGTDICELDTTTSTAYFAMTDASVAGIDSYDTISYVTPRARVREETAGASNYGLNLVSASGGTATTSTLVDAGNATPRTNPVSTTAFSLQHFGTTTDPTTNAAWTPTGTNSIDNLQLGIRTTDGTPDTWVTTAMVLVEYVDGTPPSSDPKTGLPIIWWD